jgi:DNA-binding CsgD family transcriptional regulator/ribosomal protein S27AE
VSTSPRVINAPRRKYLTGLQTRPCPKCGQSAVLLNRAARGPYKWGCGQCGWTDTTARELTPREIDIVKLLCEDMSSKEVAVAAKCSVKTAETHRANIFRKLELHSIVGLLRWAVRNKLTVIQ